MKLYLDDIRVPSHTYSNPEQWILYRSPEELISFFSQNYSLITHISFDHDLNWYIKDTSEEITGYSCLKTLCSIMIDKGINPNQYTFYFHSANPVGKQNMVSYWDNFRKYSTHYLKEVE